MGNVGGGGTYQILQRPAGEATQPKLLSLLSCRTAAALRLCSGETDSNYRLLFLLLSLIEARATRWETARKWRSSPPPPSPPPPSLFLGVRHIRRQLVVGLFTLSDVPLWQFNKSALHRFVANGGIFCKLLTLSKEVAMQSTSFTLPNLSHCCVKPVDSLLYFFYLLRRYRGCVKFVAMCFKLLWQPDWTKGQCTKKKKKLSKRLQCIKYFGVR